MKHEKTVKADVTYDKKNQVTGLVFGVLIAYAITCISFIGCALLLTHTSFAESSVPMVVTITCLLAVIVAGFDASKASGSNGWMWGMIAGALYAFVLFCILAWVDGAVNIDTRKVTLLVICLAGGGLGGIIGVNFSGSKK